MSSVTKQELLRRNKELTVVADAYQEIAQRYKLERDYYKSRKSRVVKNWIIAILFFATGFICGLVSAEEELTFVVANETIMPIYTGIPDRTVEWVDLNGKLYLYVTTDEFDQVIEIKIKQEKYKDIDFKDGWYIIKLKHNEDKNEISK